MLHTSAGANATAMLTFLWWRQFCSLKQQADLAAKWHFSFMVFRSCRFGFILVYSKAVFFTFSQEVERVRQGLGDRGLLSTPHPRLMAKPLLTKC